MDVARALGPRHRLRSVFVSDVHMGLPTSRADLLAEFLTDLECDHLYLVGDVIDGWRLRKTWHWTPDFDAVLRAIFDLARRGKQVIFIPGNHDEMFREWIGLEVAGVTLAAEAVHEAADGRRFLVMHGDEFDGVIRHAKFLAHLGDWAYGVALHLSRWLNLLRRRLGYSYWSLSKWLKQQVKEAVKTMDRFEAALTGEARRRGLDGVICGHIHHAEIQMVGGILYMNAGDWVESCTALVEHADGRFELLAWPALHPQSAGVG